MKSWYNVAHHLWKRDMSATYTIRVSDRSDDDFATLVTVLRASYRVLEPAFFDSGDAFDLDNWRRNLSDPDTEWIFLHSQAESLREGNDPAAGFAGWRLKPTQCHLHALFAAAPYQRRGYARAMLHYHWEAALRREPGIERFTLHVREPAVWARSLYESEGYCYYQPGDEQTWPALQVWIDACRQHGRWPLPAGKLLMHRGTGVAG